MAAQRSLKAEPPAAADELASGPIVLFDGVCNLCDAAVRFIVDRDPHGRFRFAALQSTAAERLLSSFDVAADGRPRRSDAGAEPRTIYLLEGGRLYQRSTAALRIARHLRAPWPLAGLCLAVPAPFRDAVYDFVAKRRYAWFGRRDACRVPTPEEARRFL